MEMLIPGFALGFVFFLMTFIGTWILRGNGLRELWPWSRPAEPPSGDDGTSLIPNASSGH
jgi:hypothetical protein